MLPVLDRYRRGARLRRRTMMLDAEQLLNEFHVRPSDPRLPYQSLSGGNQQKAMLAKWMQIQPSVMLLHEPTQGVDVGAREQVYTIIHRAVSDGASVICASSDYEQLARLCDRVLIFARGEIVNELRGGQITKETITEECFNSLTLRKAAGL
jgi:ribose transport system ATP-binding protein